jgi:hypothetical protein
MEDRRDDIERQRPSPPGRADVVLPALAAATRMFGLAGAALALAGPAGELAWTVAAGRLAAELEAAATPLWSGPGRQVLAEGTWAATDDLRREPRWPDLAGEPHLQAVHGLLCVPFESSGTPGALTAVRTARRAFGLRQTGAIVAYAGVVASLVRLVAEAASQAQTVEQLEHALDHRVVIEQAKGVLMEREGLDGIAAFDRLRQAARTSRRRVSEVAEEVVAGRPLRGLGNGE